MSRDCELSVIDEGYQQARCYDFTARDIPLMTTLAEGQRLRGVMNLLTHSVSRFSAEAPSKVRRACFETVMSGLSKICGIYRLPRWQWIRDQLYLGVGTSGLCMGNMKNNHSLSHRAKVVDLIIPVSDALILMVIDQQGELDREDV